MTLNDNVQDQPLLQTKPIYFWLLMKVGKVLVFFAVVFVYYLIRAAIIACLDK